MVNVPARPSARASTLATLDDVKTTPVTTSPAFGVVELSPIQRICGGASGASIRIVGVGTGDAEALAEGMGDALADDTDDGVSDGSAAEAVGEALGDGAGLGVCAARPVAAHVPAKKIAAAVWANPLRTRTRRLSVSLTRITRDAAIRYPSQHAAHVAGLQLLEDDSGDAMVVHHTL